MNDSQSDITQFLQEAAQGDTDAAERLWTAIYDQLRSIAHRELRRDPAGQSLNTTGLVHEAYFKFAPDAGMEWDNRRHFFATACRAMRQILVDRARYRNAQKRAGARDNVTFESAAVVAKQPSQDLVDLDEALTRLSTVNPRLCQVVECHFFGGLSFTETGEILGTSERTAERDWSRAKAYLHRFLHGE